VDDDWTVFKWSLDHSFYLEPLLFREAAHDPDAPHWKTALAHEIAFSFRGQHAFDNRLIPQEEETLGGLYTVRGYPESIAAGAFTCRAYWRSRRIPARRRCLGSLSGLHRTSATGGRTGT
jgi:hypothetical protein